MNGFQLNLFILFFFMLLPATVSATVPALQIKSGPLKIERFTMGYFIDASEVIPIENIKQQKFITSPNGLALGVHAKVTWAKIKLKNIDSLPIRVFLHNPYAYHNEIFSLYEVVKGQVTNKRILNTENKESLRWMFRGSSVFEVTVQPGEIKELYIKSIPHTHQWFSLQLYDAENSKLAVQSQFTSVSFIIGIIVTLMIYNFLLFFTSRTIENLFYALYLLSGAIWIALTYGLIADIFNAYGEDLMILNLSLILMPIFLLLFMLKIIETERRYPLERWILLSTIFLLTTTFFFGLYDLKGALKTLNILAPIMMIASLLVSISMLIRKQPTAIIFLLGHGSFLIFSSLSLLFYMGKIKLNYVTTHGIGIGILLESIILSLIIAYRIKTLESLKVHQKNLQQLASTDSLTQLFNRRHFTTTAELVLSELQKQQQPATVAMIDIDHFKNINDTYGHPIGDEVIKKVAQVMLNHSRQGDILARYGGEEFVILMPNTLIDEAYTSVERIRDQITKTMVPYHASDSLSVTVSIGIAQVNIEKESLKAAINRADKALYQAKNNGRNQTQEFKHNF